MKFRSFQTLTVLGCATLLSACAAKWDIDGVSQLPAQDGYQMAAQKAYVDIAKNEYDEGDYNDAAYFLQKARSAANGDTPQIQRVSERDLPAEKATELQKAYDQLAPLVGPKAFMRAPNELARAQAQYDCWIQEQEEGFQSEDIEACKKAFYMAMTDLEEILAKRFDLFVVLPNDDGSVGGVEVDDGTKKVVLDKPLAAARTGDDTAQSFAIEAEEVETIFGKALDSQPIPPRSFTLYFENNSTELTPASRPEIAKVFENIDSREVAEVFVIGHTDRVGGLYKNDQLSMERALAVLEYLVGRGIDRTMMQAAGRGERENLIKTKNSVPEPRNRRVEINVR